MKTDIHPPYFDTATITCACGNTLVLGSTKDKLHVEVCSDCHPFYTGNEKIIDTAGRVERFKQRTAAAKAHLAAQADKEKKAAPAKKAK